MTPSRYILPFFLVLVSGLLVVIYVQPTYKKIMREKDERIVYQQAIANVEEVRDIQAKIFAEAEAISPSDQERLKKLLPEKQDSVLLVHDIITLAQRYGIAIKSPEVSVVERDEGEDPSALQSKATLTDVKFAVSTPYSIFRTFMSALEQELSIKDVKSLRIIAAAGDNATENSVLSFEVEMTAYAYDPSSPPAAVTQ